MKRILLPVLLVLLLASCSTGQTTTQPTTSQTSTQPTTTQPTTTTQEPVITPLELEFEGSGDYLSPTFNLKEGIVVLTAQYSGDSNFIVEVVPEAATWQVLSINTIGNYSGIRAHRVETGAIMALNPGGHRLQVKGSGEWQVALAQKAFPTGRALPVEFSGAGDMVTDVFALPEGITPIAFTHTGKRNFIVEIFSVDGLTYDLTVNEIGDYDGSIGIKTEQWPYFGLGPGPHIMVIQADGFWTAKIGE